MKHIESVLVFFYARLSLKQNSRTKGFSRLSSAGHALGKKQNSARFMSNRYVPSNCFFSDQFLVTILVLLLILNFHFGYFKFAKLVSDGVGSNPGPNINGIGIYGNSKYEIIGLKESFFVNCYSAQKKASVWEKIDIDFILQHQSDNFGHTDFSIDIFQLMNFRNLLKYMITFSRCRKFSIMLMFLKTFLICLFIIILWPHVKLAMVQFWYVKVLVLQWYMRKSIMCF